MPGGEEFLSPYVAGSRFIDAEARGVRRTVPEPAIELACDASVRRPPAARLPSASDGAASAGHRPPLQRHGTAGTLSSGRGEKWGSLSGSLAGGRKDPSEGLRFRFPRRQARGRA